MTTNLAAPILINNRTNRGLQVILDSKEYELRRPIYDEVQALVNEGGQA
jgi:flagellar assembly factor FliW